MSYLALAHCDEFKESEAAMNHSLYSADCNTHLKIVVVGFLCACFVLIVGDCGVRQPDFDVFLYSGER